MSKHSKALRDHADDLHPMDRELRWQLEAAADRMEKLARRIAAMLESEEE